MVVLYFPALKPIALVASKALRGRYDFDKPKNITDLYGNQIKKKIEKSASWRYWKPQELGLKLEIQLLAEFCPPTVWHKICQYQWTVGKSRVLNPWHKELKTQGAKCQGLILPSIQSHNALYLWHFALYSKPYSLILEKDLIFTKYICIHQSNSQPLYFT